MANVLLRISQLSPCPVAEVLRHALLQAVFDDEIFPVLDASFVQRVKTGYAQVEGFEKRYESYGEGPLGCCKCGRGSCHF